jgi:hypothetical protein
MTATPPLLASRVRVIGAGVCLVLLCSCITKDVWPTWYGDTSQRPILPAEASFTKVNGAAGSGGNLFLTLRLESGEELLFAVDTGAPLTVLDKSLARKLGRRRGTAEVFYPYYARRVRRGVYRAPALYLGTTSLQTSKWVVADDLSQMAAAVPVRGILGMDCLRHYCLQLDFSASKMRFLDPDDLKDEGLGKAFPLSLSSGPLEVFVDENFLGAKEANSQIDTGDSSDGALASKLLEQALAEAQAVWTNQVKKPTGTVARRAFFPEGVFGSETYPDLMLKPHFQNTIGLRFLARHLVTFNFPKRTMFLQRQTVGPLTEQSIPNKVP